MKIALINGSPKVKESASISVLKDLKSYIDKENTFLEYSFNNPELKIEYTTEMLECDVLIFAFPLYVDGIPSHMLHCLIKLEQFFKTVEKKEIMVYALINCGFYEAKQNSLAIEMMQHWCKKAGLKWGQGLAIGAGGMLLSIANVPAGNGPKKNLGNAYKMLSTNILNLSKGDTIYVTPNFPRFAYKFAAEFGWRKTAKINGLKPRDLYRQK